MILVRNITYGFYGKNDHLFSIDKNETLLTMKQKIRAHFKISNKTDLEMFNDKTEQLIEDDDDFQSILHKFISITFSEKKKTKNNNIL